MSRNLKWVENGGNGGGGMEEKIGFCDVKFSPVGSGCCQHAGALVQSDYLENTWRVNEY